MGQLKLGRVYPITSSKNPQGFSHVELAHQFLDAGLRFFQVREKSIPDSLLHQQLLEIRALCVAKKAQFLVNDRADLALAAKADGLHLGQDDLPVEAARNLLGEEAIIGLSTHNREQFLRAQSQEINYVAIGPVFETSTKITENPSLGVRMIETLVRESRHPVVAIGGISLESAPALWEVGVQSVAVIHDIVAHPRPSQRLRDYVTLAEKIS